MPENLKAPINSKLDDFAFSINPITKIGYLSSNREGGVGDDDIYRVLDIRKPKPDPVCMQTVSGIVRDSKFKLPLAGSRLVLKDTYGTTLKDTIVGDSGEFKFTLPCSKYYTVIASKEYYKSDQNTFNTTETKVITLDFNLTVVDDFRYNEREELVIKIDPIYFDYNKANIRPDAALELDIILKTMKKYPKITIRAGSHTDARGTASYNKALSERRAKSTVQYIVSKGINPSRISAMGYGESRLTNNCVDNNRHTNRVKCTEKQHQANRRTEFVIVKM